MYARADDQPTDPELLPSTPDPRLCAGHLPYRCLCTAVVRKQQSSLARAVQTTRSHPPAQRPGCHNAGLLENDIPHAAVRTDADSSTRRPSLMNSTISLVRNAARGSAAADSTACPWRASIQLSMFSPSIASIESSPTAMLMGTIGASGRIAALLSAEVRKANASRRMFVSVSLVRRTRNSTCAGSGPSPCGQLNQACRLRAPRPGHLPCSGCCFPQNSRSALSAALRTLELESNLAERRSTSTIVRGSCCRFMFS